MKALILFSLISTIASAQDVQFSYSAIDQSDMLVKIHEGRNVDRAQFTGLTFRYNRIPVWLPVIEVDSNTGKLNLYDSSGNLILIQQLTALDAEQLRAAFVATRKDCPTEITVSPKLRRITKVQVTCTFNR